MEAKRERSLSPNRPGQKESHKARAEDGLGRLGAKAVSPAVAREENEEDEKILDAKVELEWKRAINQVPSESTISSDPRAAAIIEGFMM
jgi:hypothetical protein